MKVFGSKAISSNGFHLEKAADREICRPLQFSFQISAELSVSAAETTAVESTRPPAETAAIEPASPAVTVAPAYEATPIIAGPAIVVRLSIIIGPPIEAGTSIVAVIPRAGADENSVDEPVRPIVAIRCASIGVIPVVAISAYRGVTVTAANSNGNPNLRLRRSRRRKHANRQ